LAESNYTWDKLAHDLHAACLNLAG